MTASEKQNWHEGDQSLDCGIQCYIFLEGEGLIFLTLTFKIMLFKINLLEKSIRMYVCMCTQYNKS